jgi:hypothetical protein
MNKENLKLLAEYLLSLPENYEHFDMCVYNDDVATDAFNSAGCGTAACALGHAPYVPGLPSKFICSWATYANEVFDLHINDSAWDWCFNAFWYDEDNTPHGAAKRILYLIEHGMPEGFSYEDISEQFVELYNK